MSSALRHIFLPHHKNNHKAHIIKPLGILSVLALFLLTQVYLSLPTSKNVGEETKVLGYAAKISIEEVIRLTNQKRAENGLPHLSENKLLDNGAYSKGMDMLANDYWAHISPSGVTPWKFFNDVAYKYKFAGENLARDFSSASSAVDAWMASPSHRENMLSGKYKDIGIGVVEGDLAGVDTTIIVQFFGATASDTIPVVPIAQAQEKPNVVVLVETPAPVVRDTSAVPSTILAQAQSAITPFVATKNISAIIIFVLLGVFIADIIIVSRQQITRVSSRSLAHVSFLGIILAIVVIIEAGKIL